MKYLLVLFIGVLVLTSCLDSGVNANQENQIYLSEGGSLLPDQNNSVSWVFSNNKAKSSKPSLSDLNTEQVSALYKTLEDFSQKRNSPYVAFLSTTDDNGKNKKFKYKYFKLKPNQRAITKSEGKKAFLFHIFVDPTDHEIYQILAALIPKTKEQINIVKNWGDKLNSNESVRVDYSSSRKQSMNCTYEEGLVWDPLCECYSIGTIEVCDQQIEDQDDDGGGSTDCHYEPGGCEEDTPPNDDGGTSGNSGNSNCPSGQVMTVNGDCIDGEKPCQGNPIKNPRIAKQTQSGINGGRFGYTRSSGNQFHSGLDLKNEIGNPWFSPYDGNVDAVGFNMEIGHYITIRFQLNGEYYTMQFGHLQKNSLPPNGTLINNGDLIGIQGLSGNLENAILDGWTEDVHSHVIVRKRIGTGWDTGKDYGEPLNPETFIKTKFDINGVPNPETDC